MHRDTPHDHAPSRRELLAAAAGWALAALPASRAFASATPADGAIASEAWAGVHALAENVWAIASDGVLLYAQAWKPILINATALTLLSYLQFIIVLVILAIPAILMTAYGSEELAVRAEQIPTLNSG